MKRVFPYVSAVVLLASLTACGGGGSDSSASSDSPDSSSANAANEVSATGNASKKLTCDTDGLTVDVKQDKGDVTVSWSGAPSSPGQDFTSYITTLTTQDGQHSVQVAKKIYASGDAPTQYIWDMSKTEQENLSAEGTDVEGLKFPGALKTVGDNWGAKAVVNIDGNDAINCQ